jgi:SAM-dependent methyltransferase
VDFTDEMTVYKQEELNLCGRFCKVDVVADAADLPFKDDTFDFVISSHMLEHHWDPIKVIKEWCRVAKQYVFITVPRMDLTFDKDKDPTSTQDLFDRHNGFLKKVDESIADDHWTIWGVENFTDFCNVMCDIMPLKIVAFQEVDDKVGNGMTVLFEKTMNTVEWIDACLSDYDGPAANWNEKLQAVQKSINTYEKYRDKRKKFTGGEIRPAVLWFDKTGPNSATLQELEINEPFPEPPIKYEGFIAGGDPFKFNKAKTESSEETPNEPLQGPTKL